MTAEAQARIQQALRTRDTTLDLSDLGLTAVPDSLRDLTHLTVLNLMGNRLTTLPDWLAELTELVELNLEGNRLAVLPDWIGPLTKVKTRAKEFTALFDALHHPDEVTRMRSAHLLVRQDHTAVVARLAAMLDAERADRRAIGAFALGHRATYLDMLRSRAGGTPANRTDAALLLPLLDRLYRMYREDPAPEVRSAAFSAVCFFPEASTDPARWLLVLREAAADPDQDIRHTAAFALARLPDAQEEAANALARVLTEPEPPDSNVWQEAALVLERFVWYKRNAIPALRLRLFAPDGDDDRRATYIRVLESIGNLDSDEVLAEVHRSDAFSADIRYLAGQSMAG
jgi:HEAT repeat protein